MSDKLKALAQRFINTFGYRIEKVRELVEAPLDVLELLISTLSPARPDFFFVQVGANDGVTDDPIRKYVTKFHWRGILVEPQPRVFQSLLRNYQDEKQLIFENVAIAENDGVARFFVADEEASPSSNLTVYASLKKEAVVRVLRDRLVPGVPERMHEVEIPALSVRSLVAKHLITKVDLLQVDVQGYDCGVVRQFLACGLKPTVIHFEHLHVPHAEVQECYRELVAGGYRFQRVKIDTAAYLSGDRQA